MTLCSRAANGRRTVGADDRSSGGRGGASAESNFGIYIVVIFGGIVLLGAFGVGVTMLIGIRPNAALVPPPPAAVAQKPLKPINADNLVKGVVAYNARIGPNDSHSRPFSFRKGIFYVIMVKSQPRFPDPRVPDVDLHVYDSNGEEVAFDISEGPDSQLSWNPREDGEYSVEVKNLDPGIHVTSSVTIREEKPAALEKNDPPPLPPGTKTGKGILKLSPLLPGQDYIFPMRVKGGYRATVRVTTLFAQPDANVTVQVVKEADGAVVTDDTKSHANALVNFTLTATEIVRVRIHNASKTATSKCTVSYDGGS